MMNSNNNLSFFINNSNDNSSNNYYLVSTNSFELNTGTSLSDDSGIPQTTNSSISSGSSGGKLCKFEFELAESDCEVSQFDSLENCSDGGMSAENFNTLKKGPLAPIEPPPEFQDSPQTTLMRSQFIQNYSNKITKTILTGAVEEYTDLPFKTKLLIQEINLINDLENEDNDFEDEESFFNVNANNNSNELLYDNNDSDNIYDEPTHEYDNNISSSSLTNVKANLMLSKKKLLKMVHSSTGGSSKSEIYNYDNSFKRILTPVDSFKRRSSSSCCSKTPNSILYSPLHNHHHHLNLNLNHHTGSSNLSTITNRPHSRNSLNSRLSSSHNSLSVPTANKADDSIFITQAMSHDALLGHDISDFYNVPLDSDMYALPIDVIKTSSQILTTTSEANKITSTSVSNILDIKYTNKSQRSKLKYIRNTKKRKRAEKNAAAANVPEPSSSTATFEPMHMTLDEVKRYYHTLYSSSSDSSAAVGLNNTNSKHNRKTISNNNNKTLTSNKSDKLKTMNLKTSAVNTHKSNNKKLSNATKDECANNNFNSNNSNNNLNMNHQNIKYGNISKKSQFSINLKQKFCSIFRFRKSSSLSVASSSAASTSGTATVTTTTTSAAVATTSANHNHSNHNNNNNSNINNNNNNNIHLNHHQKEQQTKLMQQDLHEYSTNNTNRLNSNLSINTDSDKMNYDKNVKLSTRALPPLPGSTPTETDQFVTNHQRLESSSFSALPDNRSISSIDVLDDEKFYERESTMDFATNIEKVKDFGWYWGPISSDGAEKILSNEPDGSFIVRDSSDDHFIFSLTFKLNGCVRHVRIDQDQGTFSFGSCAKFKSRTIMEFIENAVEHSRSGRYLFFLHRRPEHGPMRVQLTNPVSRFKHIQSLQHMCRFVILKTVVRKDLIQSLPLPRRLLDYLGHKNCLAEQCPIDSDSSSQSQVYGENNVNPT